VRIKMPEKKVNGWLYGWKDLVAVHPRLALSRGMM
jgi:hypothetical protein